MIVLAIVSTLALAGGSFVVLFANSMRSSPGDFQGGGIILGLAALCLTMWLAWWFK